MASNRSIYESVQKLRWNLHILAKELNLPDELVLRLQEDLTSLFFALDKKVCDFDRG